MKKLSLLLVTLFVCLNSWATDPNVDWKHANPFAYDLRVSYSADMQTINFSYVLNDNAIDNSQICQDIDIDDLRGVKVYFYDKDGNKLPEKVNGQDMTKYVPGADVVKGPYSFSRSASLFTKDQPYTWVVEVHGNEKRTLPQLISSATTNRPENAYGIACDHAMNRREFGQILVSRAKQVSDAYPYNTLLEYTPQLGYVGRHDKNIHNGNSGSYFAKNSPNYEPNRVKISEDGRVFVSSYHPTAAASVLEYMGANNYRTVINNDKSINAASNDTKNVLNRRTIGMDVMGKGDDLKIVVAWIDANGYNDSEAKVEIYEYALGKANKAGFKVLDQIVGQNKTNKYVRKIAEYNAGGLLYQSFMNDGYSSIFGFLDVAYDQYGNVWMKIDYADKASCTPGKIVWFKNDGTETNETKEYTLTDDNRADGFYGGSAVLVTKDNVLFTGTGEGVIQGYDVDENGGFTKKEGWTITDNTTGTTTRIGRWVTGLALDCVNNLYALTEGVWSEGQTNFTANILTIALPYRGQSSTTSPVISTFTPQNNNPIPNICATDLRYKYVEDRCVFSFKVNTKPKMAQIRFYDNKQGMINSVNTVHADNYSGNNKQRPSFVYNVPASQLKQGKIEVTLGMCSGKLSGSLDSEGCEIINDSLPAGEWYWSVYVEAPRRSTQFAATYTQDINDFGSYKNDPHRQHATVDNNPENDGFGHIYVADHHNDGNGEAYHRHHVLGYSIGDDFADNNGSATNINVTKRYKLITKKLTNPDASNNRRNENNMMYSRRPAVAPDGRVYLADDGGSKAPVQGPNDFIHGGIWVFDPAHANNIGTNGSTATLTRFLQGSTTEATSALAFYGSGANLQVIKMNTYSEFEQHGTTGTYPYQAEKWMNNGYVLHGVSDHKATSAGTVIPFKVSDPANPAPSANKFSGGDASGCFSMYATNDGVWFCQHRDGTYATAGTLPGSSSKVLPDNRENVVLMFYKHTKDANGKITGGTRTFESYKYNSGNLTQKENSILQSTPGGGMTYQKRNGKEYLYVVNHEGNILEFEVTGANGASPSLTNTTKYVTGNASAGAEKGTKYGAISSMNFDYAGNLVATIGVRYGNSAGKPRDHQELVVYTMPYPNRVNAQEIQAPNSCLFIPERLSQEGMNQDDVEPVVDPYIISPKNCTLDFYRTLQTGSFNSICLPFSLSSLSGTPYDGAEVMKFEKARLEEVGGEQHLYFDFVEVTSIEAGVPYLIKPKTDVSDVVQFGPVRFTKHQGETVDAGEYADFIGTFAQVNMDEPTTYPRFMVVSENRLAEIDGGTLRGFRSYFQMKKDITNTISLLNFKKPTTTDTEIVVDGQPVNVEKFIREGRAYIRVGETLYTITGEVVGR